MQQRQEVEKAQAKKLAEKLAEEMKQKNLKIKKEELENLDTKRLMEIQLEQLEQEKRDLQSKMKQTIKRYDHLERAFRKEEVPLLGADYEQQKVRDRENHKELQAKARADAQAKFEQDKQTKARVLRLMGDYEEMKRQLEDRGSAEYAKAQAAAEAEMKREKAQRRQDLQLRKAIARKRAEWEEEQQRIREEQLRRAEEEAEKLAAEKKARAEKEREEYEERRRLVNYLPRPHGTSGVFRSFIDISYLLQETGRTSSKAGGKRTFGRGKDSRATSWSAGLWGQGRGANWLSRCRWLAPSRTRSISRFCRGSFLETSRSRSFAGFRGDPQVEAPGIGPIP